MALSHQGDRLGLASEERSDLARLLAKLGDALAAYTEQTPRHRAATR